jgi:hypothetical protein
MDQIPPVVWIVVALVVLNHVIPRREGYVYWLQRLGIAGLAGFFAYAFAQSVPSLQQASPIIAGVAGLLAYVSRPKRSRYIPASVKRRKIADYELRTGKKYNPRKHDLDHDVPFSQGGSSTFDNLTVRDKRANRSKGARSPWWDLFGRR